MDLNPVQFATTDYTNADLYAAIVQRPATGTPLSIPSANGVSGRDNAGTRAIEQRLWQEETARNAEYFREQRQAEIAREEQIRANEQLRRNEIANRIKTGGNPEISQPAPESTLSQVQRSTPERQPLPSTGSPPSTPNGTAARADSLVEPTATPRPAIIREAISSGASGIQGLLPRALPQAAGRLVVPGVGAGLQLAARLVSGQPVTQAVTSTGVSLIGAGVGFVVGNALLPGLGGVVGSMIGGFAGGLFSDYLFSLFPPVSGTNHLTMNTLNYPPFIGGQTNGYYLVSVTYTLYDKDGHKLTTYSEAGQVYGPISGGFAYADSSDGYGVGFYAHNYLGNPTIEKFAHGGADGTYAVPGSFSVARIDGGTDSPVNIIQPQPPPQFIPHNYDASPVGYDNTVPSGTPTAGTNKGVTRNVAPSMPSNNTPNGATFFPGHGGLAPSYLPNPTTQPSNLGGLLPQMQPIKQSQPLPFAEPEDTVVPGKGNVGELKIYGNSYPTPVPQPEYAKPVPISDGHSPVQKVNTAPIPKTPEQAATEKTQQSVEQSKKDIEDQIKRLTAIAGVIAGLTPAIQSIPDAIAKSPAVKAATQGAVCEIAQPGGCLGAPIQRAEDAANANGTKLDALNALLSGFSAASNTAQMALLNIINNKLGNQLTGGISGFLQTFFDGFNKLTEWLHLDRALNLLTFIMTVQNVYFLCDSLKVVTLQMISDTLAVFGIKDKDNNPLNLNEILGHEVESLLKSILGEQELDGIKKEWKAFNRIYQAATNMLFAIQNMVFSVLQALEIIGSWNASIGNALKKYLVVGQNAFNWMNPNPNFHNNFFKFLGNALNVVTSLDFVAQSILQGRQAIDDFGKQTDDLTKSIGEAADGFKPPEHKATAEAATTSANASKSPTPSPEDVRSVQDL